jgi:hypothetical protein
VLIDADGVLVDDLYIPQGTDWQRNYPITDPIAGTPVNVASWTLRGQIRRSAGSSTVLYDWNATAGNVVLGNGVVSIKVPAATSASWTWVELGATYDLELVEPVQGKVQRLAKGTVTVTREVTHA